MISAAEIVASIESGTASAHDVVEDHLRLAGRLDEQINAFTDLHGDTALSRALTIEPASEATLTGVPIAIKDLIDHVGHITTAGSSFYRHQPIRSATVVDRLESAGAVIIGRTGLHEFAYGFSSENAWFGPVHNPWDLALSPGGSSGGSAAAVAAGMVPGALGTDTGGSVRVPAALCGIIGLKVTHGRVPLSGILPLAESFDTVGPLARSIDDIELIYNAVRGYDRSDPWSVEIEDAASTFTSFDGFRVGIPSTWIDAVPTSSATRSAYSEFIDALTDLGADCRTFEAPELAPSQHLVTLSAAEAAGVHRAWFTDIDKHYGRDVEERLAFAMEVTVDQVIEAKRWQARLVQTVRETVSGFDVILTPTVGHARKIIGEDLVELDGVSEFYRPVLAGFTALVNQFSCPAIAVPLARAAFRRPPCSSSPPGGKNNSCWISVGLWRG